MNRKSKSQIEDVKKKNSKI